MLNCTVTYRNTDKKPYDNIQKEPTISQLADNALTNAFGGGMTKKALDELAGGAKAFREAANLLNGPGVIAARRTKDFASAAISATHVAAASNFASRAAAATFMEEPLGLGKAFCPSAG